MEIPPRREGRKEEMIPVENDQESPTRGRLPPHREGGKEEIAIPLPFPVLIPVDNDLITMLPFPMLIPVDNDLKSLALSVDVAGSKTLVAQESEGGVTGRTETASRSPSTTRPNGPMKTETGQRTSVPVCFISCE